MEFLRIGDQFPYGLRVGFVHEGGGSEVPLPLRAFFRQDMIREGPAPLHLAAGRLPESLRCSSVRL